MTSTDRLPATDDTRAALDAAAARRAALYATITPYTPPRPPDTSRNMQRATKHRQTPRILR